MVLTITLNPAIDLHLEVPRWDESEPMRASSMRRAAGGKGINVSRVLAELGVASTAAVALGGPDGAVYLDLAKKYAFEILPLPVNNPTRTNVTLHSGKRRIKINQPGPEWTNKEWHRAFRLLKQAMAGREWIVIAGAPPPGLTDNVYAQLTKAAHRHNAKVAIDCEGPALLAALDAVPALIRVNREELTRTFGIKAKAGASRAATLKAIAALLQRCEGMIVVSNGANECLLATRDGSWRALPPKIKAKGAVGSGDAMLAGFIAALMQDKRPEEALRHGLACGAACAALPETQMPSRSEIAAIHRRSRPFRA